MDRSAPTRARRLGIALSGLALLVLGGACGSSKAPVRPADDLYTEGQQNHQEEYYDAAVENYKQLLDNYPLDPRAEEIELKIAQAHYANESYPEAIAAFSDFQRMHPTSPRLPEVEYSIGQSYSDQMTTIDRDLAAATNAALRYESVIARYPRSEYADKAREKLREARAHLAERELYVATFYYGRGKTTAARGRIVELLARYPETPAAREGLLRLADDAQSAEDQELSSLVETALKEHPEGEQTVPEAPTGDAAKGAGTTGTRAGASAALAARPATANVVRALRERQGNVATAAATAPAAEKPATSSP
jgi:outer membrane protein assembly factor BamD